MNVIKGARRLVDVLTGEQHGPVRRLELLADSLELSLQAVRELVAASVAEARERRGSVLCLARPLNSEIGPGALVAAKGFVGRAGESQQQAISIDIPLAPPIWIVATGQLELVHVLLGTNVQHVTREIDGPVCIVDYSWELGRLLRVDVRFI